MSNWQKDNGWHMLKRDISKDEGAQRYLLELAEATAHGYVIVTDDTVVVSNGLFKITVLTNNKRYKKYG